jgi:putative nucleotidyltransferase with HDIG domain
MPKRAIVFITLVISAGVTALAIALFHWESHDLPKFICYLMIAVLGSTMKVKLPGMDSTMSVHFLFVLLGVLELSLSETLVIGCMAALSQCLWKQKPDWVKVSFNVLGLTSITVCSTYIVYHQSAAILKSSMPLLLVAAACTCFIANTAPIAVVIAFAERRPLRGIWSETYFWSLPYYLAGAAVAGVINFSNHYIGWQSALLVLPIMYWFYRSYHLYLGRLQDEKRRVEIEEMHVKAEKRHVEEVCALHLRTIEGLALAIDAKDHTTHAHLHRVRTYAVEIARDMGLSESEMDALRAAALLHDIGKLAMPDAILHKPSGLTAEEFNVIQNHPVRGCVILRSVDSLQDKVPGVLHHHEWVNGNGYPDRLTGDDIPLDARIIAVADVFDAITSLRAYRKPITHQEALGHLAREAGTHLDAECVGKFIAGLSRDPVTVTDFTPQLQVDELVPRYEVLGSR